MQSPLRIPAATLVGYALGNATSKARGGKTGMTVNDGSLTLLMLQTTKCGVCFRKFERHGSTSTAKR